MKRIPVLWILFWLSSCSLSGIFQSRPGGSNPFSFVPFAGPEKPATLLIVFPGKGETETDFQNLNLTADLLMIQNPDFTDREIETYVPGSYENLWVAASGKRAWDALRLCRQFPEKIHKLFLIEPEIDTGPTEQKKAFIPLQNKTETAVHSGLKIWIGQDARNPEKSFKTLFPEAQTLSAVFESENEPDRTLEIFSALLHIRGLKQEIRSFQTHGRGL